MKRFTNRFIMGFFLISSQALYSCGGGVSDFQFCTTTNSGTVSTSSYSISGVLDTTFGTSGILTTQVSNNGIAQLDGEVVAEAANAVIANSSGSIVTAGYSFDVSGSSIACNLVQYTSAGLLDSTFGTTSAYASPSSSAPNAGGSLGITVKHFSADTVCNTAVSSGGYIFAGGAAYSGPYDRAFLARFSSSGIYDSTFASGAGYVAVNTANEDVGVHSAVQTDGQIVFAVYNDATAVLDAPKIALARYSSAGVLDSSGFSGGVVTQAIGGSYAIFPKKTVVQTDGNIIVAGELVKYSSSNSYNLFDYLYAAYYSINAYFNGSMWIPSSSIYTELGLGMVRFGTDGSVDTTFGSSGIVTYSASPNKAGVNSMILQTDGKIVLGGFVNTGTHDDFALFRYNTDGSVDTTFGTNGIATVDLGSKSHVNALVEQNSQIIAGGYSTTSTGPLGNLQYNFTLARFNTTDGSQDITFGTSGVVTTVFPKITMDATYNFTSSSSILDMTLDSSGRLIVAGSAYFDYTIYSSFALARYD